MSSSLTAADTDVAETEAIDEVTPASLAALTMLLSRSPLACAVLTVSLTVLSRSLYASSS